MGDSSVAEESMAASTKIEAAPIAEGTPSSVESTPEADVLPDASQEQPAQPVKRKGGRKPIYATSEERKQRNRQAQAAFRERRTEYIKQLEAQIKQNEETLSHLQQSQRTAADECLMLRYKNSLLERILLEKGIDVQAELSMKTGSPILGPGFLPPGMSQPPRQPQAPLQRATVQQQHARRTVGQQPLPKLAPGQSHPEMPYPQSSPQGHPTPSSHASSPTNVPTRSPLTHQGGVTPPTSGVLAQGQVQQYHGYPRSSQQPVNPAYFQQPQQPLANVQRLSRPPPPQQYQSAASVVSSHSTASQHSMNPPMSANQPPSAVPPTPTAYYPSPFQKHIDQLEQEYDTEQTMLEQAEPPDPDQVSNPSPTHLHGAYPPQFQPEQQQQPPPPQDYYQQQYGTQAPPSQSAPQQQVHPQQHIMPAARPHTSHGAATQFPESHVIDPNDPLLDADPFGLSASMHYPTAYSQTPALNQPSQPR